MTYAILLNPGHNRVYFAESRHMAAAELSLVLNTAQNVRLEELGGAAFLLFDTDAALDEAQLARLAQLSFFFAMFEVGEQGDRWLKPMTPPAWRRFDDNLVTILRYTGKTNELFTRLLVGVAQSTATVSPERFRLLDPVAGKGTTLFEGLIRGMDVCGMEVGDKPVREAVSYMKKYLETERVKHSTHAERFSGPGKSFIANRNQITIEKTQQFELISGNSRYADQIYGKNSFHLIVGDLPYGVQHGNVTGEGQSALTRSSGALLDACLPSWRRVLCSGGAVVLSWNTLVFPRADMCATLQKGGFTVLGDEEFAHRVDNSIRRDIVRAVKP